MSIIGPIPCFQQNKIAKKKKKKEKEKPKLKNNIIKMTVTLDNSIIKHAEGWRLS